MAQNGEEDAHNLQEDIEGIESNEDDEEDQPKVEDLNLVTPPTLRDNPKTINRSSTIIRPAVIALPTISPSPILSVTSDFSSDPNRQSIITSAEDKKPLFLDDSRRLFQRLWTDEDEIGLLQGFLDYTKQRGHKNQEVAPFYDQIKTKLQLDFNRNQLFEKLRRLKKKYRNVISRINSGKDLYFKTPHDQATFEISRKIWNDTGTGIEEDEGGNPNHNNNHGLGNHGVDANNDSEKTIPGSRKRPRTILEEHNLSNPSNISNTQVDLSISTVIEDTLKNCLSPLFKNLLSSAINRPFPIRGLEGIALNSLPLNFVGSSSLNSLTGEIVDEKWRKQRILELEVYSKRMELVQDQIKVALEELRTVGGS